MAKMLMDDASTIVADDDDEMQAPGYCIEIRVKDGQISIATEDLATEEAEEAGEPDKYVPVKSLMAALNMVKQIYRAGGDMTDQDAEAKGFAEGYKNG